MEERLKLYQVYKKIINRTYAERELRKETAAYLRSRSASPGESQEVLKPQPHSVRCFYTAILTTLALSPQPPPPPST